MITTQQIAKFINGELSGDKNLSIRGPFDLLPGLKAHFSFLDEGLKEEYIEETKSDLIIISNELNQISIDKAVIRVSNPKKSFFEVVKKYFYTYHNNNSDGIHPSAIISKKTKINSNVNIGANVIIEEGVKIGKGTSIAPNSFIGKETNIGDNTIIHPNVTIYNNIYIGNNVIINSGSVLGAHGFGILKNKDKNLLQVPHTGIVEIKDNVIIGSGCTVDRATMSKTCIGEGTKIDGQVHIAHNVKVGKNCIIAGQSAIGGSTKLGNNVILGGQVGIIDNLTIGNNCIVAAKSAVMKSLDDNSIVSGIPAINHAKKRRLDVLYSQLPELIKKIKNN